MAGKSSQTRRAGFDIRLIIALLIGVYGLVLVIMGVGFTAESDIERAAGININLWAGVGMLIFTALMVLWAVLRPIRIPDSESGGE